MIGRGVFARCERCGFNEFFPDDENSCGEIKFGESLWDMVQSKHVCPSCYEYYEKMLDQFFNDFWDK